MNLNQNRVGANLLSNPFGNKVASPVIINRRETKIFGENKNINNI
jgi:hypothetical protein